MERRKYERARRRELLINLLRFILFVAMVVGGYFAVKYVFQRSDEEIAKVKEREESEYYLIVDQPVRMTVVDDTGQLSMEIRGQEVRLTADHNTAIFTGADATYYEGGKESIVMHADNIKYDMRTEDFELDGNLNVRTNDGMSVAAEKLVWRRVKTPPARSGKGAQLPSFSFPAGVEVFKKPKDKNGQIDWQSPEYEFQVLADYMQADKDLNYMEFIGHVHGEIVQLEDTGFIGEREITEEQELNFEDFERLGFEAEQLLFDNQNQVVLATSRYYDRRFIVIDPDGNVVNVDQYQTEPEPVTFSKEEITIQCHHLEAKIKKKWAACVGDIAMVIPPAEPEEGDDKALKVVKRFTTRISSGELEYFWGQDHVITHSPTRVEQEDRLALADRITYWGAQKQVLLDGHITVVQGSGQWLVDEDLIQVEDHDMERAVTSYTELYADRAVIYLNNNDFIASGDVMARQDERETAADTIVYQDEIKRITAQGNVKFLDKDGQMLLCGGLVFHNDYDFMEVSGGASATIRLPAKYANDINKTLADVREEEAPAPITDPPVPEEVPHRNPNEGSTLVAGLRPMELPEVPESQPEAASTESGITPLAIPGQENGTASNGDSQLSIQLDENTTLDILGGEFIPDETAEEGDTSEDEEASEEGNG